MFGREIIIDGTVEGDVIAFGGIIEINGVVTGDLIAAGAGITVNGEVRDDVRAAGSGIVIAGAVGDDLIAAGGGGLPGMPIQIGNRSVESGIRVAQDATVGGDAIIAGDRGLIAGEIARNLFAGMNSLAFNGRVGGDAQLHAKTLVIGNGAEVGGTLSYSSATDVPMPADVADAVVVQPWQEAEAAQVTPVDTGRDLTVQFGWWLLRTILAATGLALAGWLLLSFAPALIQKPSAALDAKPAESVIFGFLAIAVSFPLVAALVFMGGIFWGFSGGLAMLALSFGTLTTIWLLSSAGDRPMAGTQGAGRLRQGTGHAQRHVDRCADHHRGRAALLAGPLRRTGCLWPHLPPVFCVCAGRRLAQPKIASRQAAGDACVRRTCRRPKAPIPAKSRMMVQMAENEETVADRTTGSDEELDSTLGQNSSD